MDQKALDLAYSPSDSVKRFPTAEEACVAYENFTANESKRVRETIPFKTVQYGDRFPGESFDIYGTDLPKDAPIYVFIHGGYWQIKTLCKETHAFVVPALVAAGIKVIVVNYEKCPTVSLEQLVDEMERAIDFILDFARQNNTRSVCIGGHSAGAHLAACMYNHLVESNNPHRLIVKSLHFIAGVYDVSELRFTNTANADNILGITDDNCKKLSPIFFNYSAWARDGVRIHVYNAEQECSKLSEHTLRLHDVLVEFNCNVEFHLMNGCDHFDIAEKLVDPSFEINKIIVRDS